MKSKLPAHLEYLTYTVDKIINFLKKTNEQKAFLDIVEKAKNDYKKPQENFISGFIFKKSSLRESVVKNFIEKWNNSDDTRTKLWDFNDASRLYTTLGI